MRLKKSIIAMQFLGVISFSPMVFAEEVSGEIKETPSTDDTETLVVTGRALTLYQAEEGSLSTRSETPVDKSPQSMQILTHDLIADQAANEVTDLFRSLSGVSYFNYGVMKVRGFEQESQVLYDGVKGDPFRTFTVPQLFNIDQVQVLKGPSGALYGAGEAGGVVNYVTKKPSFEQQTTVELTAGNKDFLSGSIETSGPANADASQRYRVGIYSSGEDSYRNNVEEDNLIIDLGYAWDLNDLSTLTLQYTHFYQLGERLRGVPIDSDGNFLADTSWSSNEPSDYQKFQSDIIQANLEHSINDWLDGNFSIRMYDTKEVIKFHQARSLVYSDDADDSNDYVTRRYQDQVRYYKGLDLASSFVAERGDHTVVIGADYHFANEDEVFYYSGNSDGTASTPSNLFLSDPTYGDDISAYSMSLNRDRSTDLNQVGIYIQDQWQTTDRLNIVAGGRVDYVDENVVDNDDGSDNASYHDVGYSARIGATYEVSHQFKPYASYSTGLTPQSASDQLDSQDGSLFDPEENRQFEIGARSYLFNHRLSLNTAVYHIVKNNIVTEDPIDDDYNVAIGEIRSQGFELDALAQITPVWVANISYAYNDLEVSDSDDSLRALSNSPHNQLGVWTRYELPSLNSSIAFGADYVSEQTDRNENTIKPYTIYDMSWQTNWNQWKFQANVKNLFDEEYAIAGFNSTSGAIIGERRRLYLKAAYQF
ncbi:TonB-dependent siderophore receptor [Vibrio sp. RC27]